MALRLNGGENQQHTFHQANIEGVLLQQRFGVPIMYIACTNLHNSKSSSQGTRYDFLARFFGRPVPAAVLADRCTDWPLALSCVAVRSCT